MTSDFDENKSVDNFMKMDVMGRQKNVTEIAANDVPKNGLIARVLGERTSYCHKIDK